MRCIHNWEVFPFAFFRYKYKYFVINTFRFSFECRHSFGENNLGKIKISGVVTQQTCMGKDMLGMKAWSFRNKDTLDKDIQTSKEMSRNCRSNKRTISSSRNIEYGLMLETEFSI